MKWFPVTGSRIADLVILAIIGYIIYGIATFGIPDMGGGKISDEPDEIDVMELF